MRVFKPKHTDGREYERWLLDVSKQVDAAQPLSDNEVMTYMLSNQNQQNITAKDLQDIRTSVEMIATDTQTARNALRLANDASLLAYMGGW
jgi:hypothetical protein